MKNEAELMGYVECIWLFRQRCSKALEEARRNDNKDW